MLIKKVAFLSLLPVRNILEGFDLLEKQVLEKYSNNVNCMRFFKIIKQTWMPQAESISYFSDPLAVNNYYTKYLEYMNARLGNNPTVERFLSKY